MDLLTRKFLGWLVVALGFATAAGQLHGQAAREYDIKAVFLYNFATFVDWPPEAFSHPESPFIIGILGDDPFGEAIDAVVASEQVGTRPIVVERFDRIDDAVHCHILFICRSEAGRLREILAATRRRPVLTVGDMHGFADRGGMINLTPRGRRVGLEINAAAIADSQLTANSKLLQLARVVHRPGS